MTASARHFREATFRFLTPGAMVLIALGTVGMAAIAYRFLFGLQSTTNLDDAYPWGLWKAFNVTAGIAAAAGGFTSAALIHVFHREQFHSLGRSAILAAALGYTFAVLGLIVDLGRYYNIWHPILPSMWQGDSVLFEVAMCVMAYLVVLYIELSPAVCERLARERTYPRLASFGLRGQRIVSKFLFPVVIAGVVISCLHQSSLGNLMVIAPTKIHPLWYTPILPLLFLLSAVAVGFPAIIMGSLYASWSFGRQADMATLERLARYVPPLVGVYLVTRAVDFVIRDAHAHLSTSTQSWVFLVEVVVGFIVPTAMLMVRRVRRSPNGLFAATLLLVAGTVMNRLDTFLVAYRPPFATHVYFPSAGEFAVSIGLIAILLLCFRAAARLLPILPNTAEMEST